MDFQSIGSSWLWLGEEKVNTYLRFKQSFFCEGEAELYIAADTNFAAFLNGEEAGFGGFLSYPEHKFYEKLPLHPRKGENSLTILAYYQGVATQCYQKGIPGAIWAIRTGETWISNQNAEAAPDNGYHQGEIELITSQLGPSFAYDAEAAQEPLHWQKAEVQPFSACLPAAAEARPVHRLVTERMAEGKLLLTGNFLPDGGETPAEKMQNAYLKTDGTGTENRFYLFDLGRETAGYFTMELKTDKACDLLIGYGEHLEDLRPRTAVGGRNFAFAYRARAGEQRFFQPFRRIAGRYIMVYVMGKAEAEFAHIGVLSTEYPLTMKKPLQLSDALDRKIYDTGIDTLRLSMHEHFEDCPWREQCLYAMDGYIQYLSGREVFEYSEFVQASLELLRASVGEDGHTDICAPCKKELVIPAFSMMWVIFACDFALTEQNKAYARELLPTVLFMLRKWWSERENDLYPNPTDKRYWNFYDWAEGLSGQLREESAAVTEAPINLYFALALQKAAALCAFAEDSAQQELCGMYDRLKAAINKTFLTDSGVYATRAGDDHRAELTQALAIVSRVAPEPAALRRVLADPDNGMVKVTLSTSAFRYMALLEERQYHAQIREELRRIWGGMLFGGATSFYEVAEGAEAFSKAGSLCHGWSSVPVYVLSRLQKANETGIAPGKYRHYKGNEYEVIDVASHSETLEAMVVYRALYGEHGLWVRPAAMWNETVEVNGKRMKRFERIER